jgi:hypothetical protein
MTRVSFLFSQAVWYGPICFRSDHSNQIFGKMQVNFSSKEFFFKIISLRIYSELKLAS